MPYFLANSIRSFTLKLQNAVQKGFNALVHCLQYAVIATGARQLHQISDHHEALVAAAPPAAVAVEEEAA